MATPRAAMPGASFPGDEALQRALNAAAEGSDVADPARQSAALMSHLIAQRLDRVPLPGSGATLQRWQALAQVAAHDLSLAKLYEGHTDALAILQELEGQSAPLPGGSWCVWAAEAPEGRVTLEADGEHSVLLSGRKCWCSGAASADHALLTAWYADGRGPQLVHVALAQPGIEVLHGAWHAVGMAGSASLDVSFDRALGRPVGLPGDYLSRPGFWQGGAGIAACWHGGAMALADTLKRSLLTAAPAGRSALRLAALGHVDLALAASAALLREAACWIDDHPLHDASEVALRVRLAAEDAAGRVLDQAGRALGATPFCRDARFARMAADLPVFVRQSHAERDFAALGERLLAAAPEHAWLP